jgi:hypothetical protein
MLLLYGEHAKTKYLPWAERKRTGVARRVKGRERTTADEGAERVVNLEERMGAIADDSAALYSITRQKYIQRFPMRR